MTPRRSLRREFWSMGEVCALFDVKPHVLRYWEQQFESLKPTKSRQGARLYRAKDLETIALIHQLVREERYTLEGARQRVDELRGAGEAGAVAAAALERNFLRSLRGELQEVLAILGPAGG